MNVFVAKNFSPVPSLAVSPNITVTAQEPESGLRVYFVQEGGQLPANLDLSWDQLEEWGFTGKKHEHLFLPAAGSILLLGVGSGMESACDLRDATAAAVLAMPKAQSFVFDIPDCGSCARRRTQLAIEGAMLARYNWDALKAKKYEHPLRDLTFVVQEEDLELAQKGILRGRLYARATSLARDLTNTPPRHLNAVDYAKVVEEIAPSFGLTTEIFDKEKIIEMGLGGVLGVNAASDQEPRVICVRYVPEHAQTKNPQAKIALVGKGITYDSGGISLKPSNASHALMKMDMEGSAVVLSTMSTLRDLGVQHEVVAWLMCTDNMPSGKATKLGDVLTIRNGKTVEVKNTDAEGRLVLADGLALAVEEKPDVIVDVATLTGAAMAALGTETAALFSNSDSLAEQLERAAVRADERVWRMPLDHRYCRHMKSLVADISNMGGPYGGAITAALFLENFVENIHWAHLDIAPVMSYESQQLWLTPGASGFGARLLSDFIEKFETLDEDVVEVGC